MLRDWATLEAEDLDRVFAPTRGQAVFFDLDLRDWRYSAETLLVASGSVFRRLFVRGRRERV